MTPVLSSDQLSHARKVVRKAGADILGMRERIREKVRAAMMNPDTAKQYHKLDGSPFCEADIESHTLLVEGLHPIDPTIRVLSEENPKEDNAAIFKNQSRYWAIDPLDLTNRYLRDDDQYFNSYFSINVALMENGTPVEGIQFFPALDIMYYTDKSKAWRQEAGGEPIEIHVRAPDPANKTDSLIVASHPQDKVIPDMYKQIVAIGRHRACMVAEGSVSFCNEHSGFCLWDIAAIHAVVNAAGGCFRKSDGTEMSYDTIDNLPAFFAGHPKMVEQIIDFGASSMPISASGR